MTELRLTTTLEPFGPAAAIVLSEAQVAALGAGATPPVQVTIAGRSARLRVARMGGVSCIGFSKAVRAQLGVEPGDNVEAVITLDSDERVVEVPEVLAAALDAAGLRAHFDRLSYTRRKEYARSVTEAKQEATRDRRITKILAELS